MGKTFTNEITAEVVSLALEHILVAPEGTAYDRSRIDISSPPAGFFHLGAVSNDSPQITIQKGKYQLFTGIPATLAYEAVVAINGELSCMVHNYDNRSAFMGLGGPRPRNIPITAHSTAATMPTVTADTVSRTHISVSTTAGIAVSAMVVTDVDIETTKLSYNVAYVKSVDAVNDIVVLSGTGFPFTPVTGEPVINVERTELDFGSRLIPYFRILGVADFLNNAQIIHDLPRATPRGQWAEALQPGQDARLPVVFDLFGTTSADTGSDETILGRRFVLQADTIQ